MASVQYWILKTAIDKKTVRLVTWKETLEVLGDWSKYGGSTKSWQ